MEPQDDEGLFAQTGQDNQPDVQTGQPLSDEGGQIPANEQPDDGMSNRGEDDLDVPSEDGMAQDDTIEDDDDSDTAIEGETVAPGSAI